MIHQKSSLPAISIQGLSKTYASGTQALKGVDLEIQAGDFFALLGANGAGKTTIIGILTGIVRKTSGKAKIFNFDIDTHHDQAKYLVGVVPQEFNFNIFEKVIDIVVTQAGYYGIPRSVALKRAEVVLKALDLWEKRNGTARSLSGGMKRRLMIARALMHEPKLLILDEPTAGVDVELRYGMWEYLNELNRQGTTILLTTHYLEEVEQLCRNVAIIKQGEIVKQGAVKTLMHSLESQHYILTVDDLAKNFELKKYISTQVDDNTLEVEMKQGSDFQDLFSALAEQGVKVRDIRPKGNRMESLFLNILNTP